MTDDVHLEVRFQWRPLGLAVLDAERRLRFPSLPAAPGLYRFSFTRPTGLAFIYIGETIDVRRRMAHYRNPGPSQQTNLRMNGLMRDHLSKQGTTLEVAAVDAAWIVVSGADRPLDFASRSARLLAENAALTAATAEGIQVHNL